MNLFFHKGALIYPSQKQKKIIGDILILIRPMLVISICNRMGPREIKD